MDARFCYGNPIMTDVTPEVAISAGDVVIVGTGGPGDPGAPFIAHADIAAGDLGSLAVSGGVYEVTALEAIQAGTKVYWNEFHQKISLDAGSTATDEHIGLTIENFTLGGVGKILHRPDGIKGS